MRRKKARIKPLDIVLLLLVSAAAYYVYYRLKVGLSYKWNWGALIPQYFFRYDPESQKWVANLIMFGLYNTIRLSIWGTLLATLLGVVMGIFRLSESLFKRLIGRTYVELIRNIPPIVLIFVFYFFVSDQILPIIGVDEFIRNSSKGTQAVFTFILAEPRYFSAFISAVITIALFEGAYITEIVRAGIQSIERGQWEASYALGLSWWQQMRYVILPQATKRILPPLAGQFISTIKDSAIVSVISIQELTFQAMELMASTYRTFECWIIITVLYLVLTLSLSLAVERLEIYMRKSEA